MKTPFSVVLTSCGSVKFITCTDLHLSLFLFVLILATGFKVAKPKALISLTSQACPGVLKGHVVTVRDGC